MNRPPVAASGQRGDDPGSIQAPLYPAHAWEYARLWSPVIRPMGKRLLDAMPLAGAVRILDVGTGIGAHLPDIRAIAPDAALAGVDRSEGMLRIAQETGRIPLSVMDA